MTTKKKSRVKKATKIQTITEPLLITECGNRVKWGIMSQSAEEAYFKKSARSDYGRAIDITIPLGYHAQVKKSWEMYETDRLFRYLVDRCSDFGANGFEWEIPIVKSQGLWNKIKDSFLGKKITKEDKEKMFWDIWAARINEDVANVISGIDEINKWMFKHISLAAMVPLEWEWGTMKIDDEEFQVPLRMVSHNPLSISLVRKNQKFIEEQAFLKISTQKNIEEANKTANLISMYAAPENSKSWHELNLMGVNGKKKSTEAFILKYNWTPGDNTALVYGRNVSVGQGLYPTPPYVGLYEILIQRRALHAADLAILDGVINYILDWKIGDNTIIKDRYGNEKLVNQPRPQKKDSGGAIIEESSIAQAQKIITSDTRGPVMQIFHPYYIELGIKMPDINLLINADKYKNSTVEMYQGFGILMQDQANKLSINTSNFEQIIENIRHNHIKRFWESLAGEIINRNKKKLTAIPNMVFKPLNTKTQDFRDSLLNLAKIGKVSSESLLQAHGLDKDIELQRIAKEVYGGEKTIYDDNVPISFVQKVAEKSGGGSKTSVSSTRQTGRPTGTAGGKKESTKKKEG